MEKPAPKSLLHPRNKHQNSYDLEALCAQNPELKAYVFVNKFKIKTINFALPKAVLALNKALLKTDYGLTYWELPAHNLCPPVPGRADLIHHMADLLARDLGRIPMGPSIKGLDIGTGASLIYPILGQAIYQWQFVGTDICEASLVHAQNIIHKNQDLKDKIGLRHQPKPNQFFNQMILPDEFFSFVVCNPPFFASAQEAQKASARKVKNLSKGKKNEVTLNFSGNQNELICEGGELKFVAKMIKESKRFGEQCLWFSSLISNQKNLAYLSKTLEQVGVAQQAIVPMGQGQKTSHLLVWSFFLDDERQQILRNLMPL
jgi:23S rRNA (adenine1618-N6)-methyltransferase